MLILSKIAVVVVVVVVAVPLASATVATTPSNSTERRRTAPKTKPDRQSVHYPVLILAIVVRKTNVVGRDRTTIAPAACLPHSCQWSFVAIVHVVVAVASGNVIVDANSAVPLWCFRFIVILSSVCTSSVWNPVKRIFLGSARDGGQYPWLTRHNQPSTRPMATRTTTSSSLCVCMFGGAVPPPCVPLCLGPSILSLVHSIIDCCTTPIAYPSTKVSVSSSMSVSDELSEGLGMRPSRRLSSSRPRFLYHG